MITGVVVALIVVAAILVGLPLVAWWVGNRRFWGRLRPSPAPVRRDDLRRRLGVSATELTEAEKAARAGRALAEPAMRAAVVALAEDLLERQRTYLIVGRAAGVVGIAALVAGPLLGEFRPGTSALMSVAWLITVLNLFAQAAAAFLVHRRFRRAIELNSEPPER